MSSRASMWFGAQIEDPTCASPAPSSSGQSKPASSKPVQTASIRIQPEMEQFVYERYFQEVTRRDFHQSSLLLQYARERQTTPHMMWLNFTLHIQKYNLENTLANLIEYLSVTAKRNDGKNANYAWSNNTNSNANYNHRSVDTSSAYDAGYSNSSAVINSHGFDVISNNAANNQHGFDIVNISSANQGFNVVNFGGVYFDSANRQGFDINHDVGLAQNVNTINTNISVTAYQNVNNREVFNSSVEELKVEVRAFIKAHPYTHADFLRVKKDAEEAFEKQLLEEERKRAEEEKKNEVLRNIHEMLK